MYGMVTKSVKEMITQQFGDDAWEQVRERAGVEDDVFISNDPYPDEITYRLVGAAAEVLDLPVTTVLETFGRHWILCTAQQGYGELMQASGRSFDDFLVNLPNFHTRICMIFPDLRPPDFSVTNRSAHSLHLHYRTHREGLTHFVIGLLAGLGKMFETEVTTTLIESRAAGADHDVFLVEWEPAVTA